MFSALTAAASGIAEQKIKTSPAGQAPTPTGVKPLSPAPAQQTIIQQSTTSTSTCSVPAINVVKVDPTQLKMAPVAVAAGRPQLLSKQPTVPKSAAGPKDNGANPTNVPSPAPKARTSAPPSSNPTAAPAPPARRRRGRQKVRNIVKIPGTDRVEIYCIHGCGCKYETKVFSSDRDAWHKALRCINAHESQRCSRNKNSTRCYKNKEAKKEKKVPISRAKKRKVEETGYPPAKMGPAAVQAQQVQSQAMNHAAYLAQQHVQLAQQQYQAQIAQQQYAQQMNGMGGQMMFGGMLPMGADQPGLLASAQGNNFMNPQTVGAPVSQQCSQYCRYRRAVAELMLENSRLKQDCARLKDLLNSVSGHLHQNQQQFQNRAPVMPQQMPQQRSYVPQPQSQQQQPQQAMLMQHQQQQQPPHPQMVQRHQVR